MKKTVVIIVIVILLASSLLFINPELFQGKLLDGPESVDGTQETEQVSNEPVAQPDLVPDMAITIPENPLDDIEVTATIRNTGEGALTGDTPFVYSIYMNGAQVFSNTDSYTTMEPGDEFSFTYPISRAIYPDDSGTITFKVDDGGAIDESDENNNEIAKEFSF